MASETSAAAPALIEPQGQLHERQDVEVSEEHVNEAENRFADEEEKERSEAELRQRMRKTLLSNGYAEEQVRQIFKGRPTYLKVHSKHLDPETLDMYDLPWEWCIRDPPYYIIVKIHLPEHDQDILFRHTRRLQEIRRRADDHRSGKRQETLQQLLFKAIELGSLAIAEAVLRGGANPFKKNESGKTASEVAGEGGHGHIVNMLKRAKLDKLIQEEFGERKLKPLPWFVIEEDRPPQRAHQPLRRKSF